MIIIEATGNSNQNEKSTKLNGMKQISILVPQGAVALGCIEGPFILFNKVNEFLENVGKPALFHVQLVGATKESQVYAKFFTVTPDCSIKEVHKTHLIIIPALNGSLKIFIPLI